MHRLSTNRRYARSFKLVVIAATVVMLVGAGLIGWGHVLTGVLLAVAGFAISLVGGRRINRARPR